MAAEHQAFERLEGCLDNVLLRERQEPQKRSDIMLVSVYSMGSVQHKVQSNIDLQRFMYVIQQVWRGAPHAPTILTDKRFTHSAS